MEAKPVRPALIDRRQGVPGMNPPFIKIGNIPLHEQSSASRQGMPTGNGRNGRRGAATGPPAVSGDRRILVCRVFLSLIQ